MLCLLFVLLNCTKVSVVEALRGSITVHFGLFSHIARISPCRPLLDSTNIFASLVRPRLFGRKKKHQDRHSENGGNVSRQQPCPIFCLSRGFDTEHGRNYWVSPVAADAVLVDRPPADSVDSVCGRYRCLFRVVCGRLGCQQSMEASS